MLPKKDKKFEEFINHVNQTAAGPLSQEYSALVKILVKWLLDHVCPASTHSSLIPDITTSQFGHGRSPALSQETECPNSPLRYDEVPYVYTSSSDFTSVFEGLVGSDDQ